mmetsp:Transcript_1344/g.2893  ORF Transcript_1344/g.2893 Transcript_1344/m.2893 type:complete len:215 (-) Transcript_1344:141-785(-)
MSNIPMEKLGSCFEAAPAATRLVLEPISVIVPPSIVANDSGISSCLDDTPRAAPHSTRTGKSIAQTGVLLRKAEMARTGSSMRKSVITRPCGLPSNTLAMSCSPPVHCTLLATALITPTATTPSERKPSSASFIVMTPVATNATTVSSSTCSAGASKDIWTSATTRATTVTPALRGNFGSTGSSIASASATALSCFQLEVHHSVRASRGAGGEY